MIGLVAAAGPSPLWYATRGSGVVTLALLTAVVCLGILTSVRWRTDRLPRFVVAGLHRNLTLLAVAFLGVHVATAIADSFAPIRIRDAVVPFLSPYRPLWLGLGTVACDLLLAVVLTSLLRARFGYRTWRATHWLAYASWPLALLHSLGTGSDARFGWMAALGLASVGAVLASVLLRISYGGGELAAAARRGPRGGRDRLRVAALVPDRAGGARVGRAGRHAERAPPSAGRPAHGRAAPPRRPTLPRAFAGRLTGTLTETGPDASGLDHDPDRHRRPRRRPWQV